MLGPHRDVLDVHVLADAIQISEDVISDPRRNSIWSMISSVRSAIASKWQVYANS